MVADTSCRWFCGNGTGSGGGWANTRSAAVTTIKASVRQVTTENISWS
ncbi:MAG: hypothetical protein M3297_01455 [Thermoproteota archaeon]|nr:hypothetical protein [Thermoproteota archaeon]